MTELLWDLTHTEFMDVAGLHLLFTTPAAEARRRTSVTGLRRQRLRVLHLAAGIDPTVFDLTRVCPPSPTTHAGNDA
ncbi:hypothetical protein [Streptomyces sp. BK79]|uniref:hypothetical protein n=1 Tax=Streptomyces sp. BK79 TaxID=3350097 RepID=UPI00376F4E8E